MKKTRLINRFLEKILAILDPKIVHRHNSGFAVRIFFKFCPMKGANRIVDKNDINNSQKKMFGANEPFWAPKWHILIILDPL